MISDYDPLKGVHALIGAPLCEQPLEGLKASVTFWKVCMASGVSLEGESHAEQPRLALAR